MEPNHPIGGYFELETYNGVEYWENVLRINTARNCLRYLIQTFHIRKLYVPRYTCPVVWDAIQMEHCEMEYYSVDRNFMPLVAFPKDAYILYTNYLGVCTENSNLLAKKYERLIIDCSQSFYSSPVGLAAFNSARKFFGVPDGAYLFMDKAVSNELKQDHSVNRFAHLLERVESGPQPGYRDFLQNENLLCGAAIKTMSKLTQKILKGISYHQCADTRRSNYAVLQESLSDLNEWKGTLAEAEVPMAYPFICKKDGLREKLISENIFVPTFWKGQKDTDTGEYMEHYLLPLPIDQRYGRDDMLRISECIFRNLKM